MIGSNSTSVRTLASVGKEIATFFLIIEVPQDNLVELKYSVEVWTNESQRFNLWANNLGLHHGGHSSLDYRLRDAPILENLVRCLLNDLRGSLDDLITLDQPADESEPGQSGGGNDSDEDSSDEIETDDEYLSDYRGQSEVETILKGVIDIIDRLYRVAIKLRSPRTRLASTKSVTFKKVDEETGVDLIQEFVKVDTCHIKELFSHPRLVHPDDTEGIPKETKYYESRPRKLTELDDKIIERLARANTRRRQQFAYWSWHRSKNTRETVKALELQARPADKLAVTGLLGSIPDERRLPQGRQTSINEKSANTMSRPSTATYLDTAARIGFNDNTSTTSVRTFIPAARNVQDEVVDVPQPPDSLRKTKHFQCPFCFTLCSQSLLKEKAWREHIFRDLRPYICTYAYCKSSDQLYDSYKDWITHEQNFHCSVWRCAVHPELAFSSKLSLEDHWSEQHVNLTTSLDMKYAAWAIETTSTTPDRPCPVCLYTPSTLEEMQHHIATHLQRIALFALPRWMDLEDVSNQGSESSGDADAGISNLSRTSIESLGDVVIHGIAKQEPVNPLTREILLKINDPSESPFSEQRVSDFVQDTNKEIPLEEDIEADQANTEMLAQQKEKLHDKETGSEGSGTWARMKTSMDTSKTYGKRNETDVIALPTSNPRNTLRPEDPETWKRIEDLAYKLLDQTTNIKDHFEAFLLGLDEGNEQSTVLTKFNDASLILNSLGKYDKAEIIAELTLKLRRVSLGSEHVDTLKSMHCLVMILLNQVKQSKTQEGIAGRATLVRYYQEKLTEAEKMTRQTLKLRQEILGEEHMDTLGSMEILGSVLETQHHYAKAEMIVRRTIELQEKTLGMEHVDTLRSMNRLEFLLESQGFHDKAQVIKQWLQELHEKMQGRESDETFKAMKHYMRNYMSVSPDQGKHPRAEEPAGQTPKISREMSGLKKKLTGDGKDLEDSNESEKSEDLKDLENEGKEAEGIAEMEEG